MFQFLNSDDSKFLQAKANLQKLSATLHRIGIDFTDLSYFDLEIKKNKWVSIPEKYGAGVHIMGIHLDEDYRSVLMHFEPYSHLNPHVHKEEFEVLKIVEGFVRNMVNGEIYERGDVLFIPKSEVHHIVTEARECYMYAIYTKDAKHLKIPHQEEQSFEKYISKSKDE